MLALALLAPQLLATDLDSILDNPLVKGCAYSAYVAKLDGTVLYDRNSTARLLPASNEKLFTAAFALYALGSGYHPTTKFWKMSDKVVVETTGDPMLSYADLVHARDEMHLSGHDPVYVKEPYRIGYLPQWEYDDLPNKYAAPVTGLTVDRGSCEIWEDSHHCYFEPAPYGIKVSTIKSGSRHVHFDPFTKIAKVFGPAPDKAEMLDTLSIPDPDKAAASILGDGFHLLVAEPSTPPDLVLEGPTLPQIVKECLVHSDNNLAENLLLLGALGEGPLGDEPYDIATEREREFLTKTVGIGPDEIRPSDGSGLSRYNLATTHSIAKVLEWESGQPTFDNWRQSLASPGNGTLKNRLEYSSFVGKTGSMTGVTALSGYVTDKDGETLVVSTIFNNHLCPNSEIRDLQDQFIRKIESSHVSGTFLEEPAKRESHHAEPGTRSVPSHRIR